jgi:ubiquinone/menaquinone biosynthesis C-methylase UbiE
MERLAFGGALQRARTACLADAREARRALILGEGDGRFLRELLRQNATVEVDCVDGSARMLELARTRIGDEAHRVRFIGADALAWHAERRDYDLVVTHFFLDCFDGPSVRALVDKLAAASQPRATWLLADFTIPRRRWHSWHARLWVSSLYAFFRLATGLRTRAIVDPAPLLEAHGFRRTQDARTRLGMLSSASWRRG